MIAVVTPQPKSAVHLFLKRLPASWLGLFATAMAFSTYFCMYAFRKPVAAASFEGESFLGTEIGLKTAVIIGQIVGYTISKYIGVRLCSELTPARRRVFLLGLIGVAEISLVAFALVPRDLRVVAIFVNGLPLGMVWGVVVSYLEGRRASDWMMAGLSCSYIIASGVVKDVGRWLMNSFEIPELWMPAATGALFALPFLAATYFLDQVPQPNAEDIEARSARTPMFARDRMAFFRRFGWGLTALMVSYFFLTALRDYRDNYGIELFREMGIENTEAIFSKTELPVAFIVMAIFAVLVLVKDRRKGMIAVFVAIVVGFLLVGISTVLYWVGAIDGLWWMILLGIGSYLAYVPYGAMLFERIMAATRATGTAIFAIYLSDAFGYTGSICLQLYKDLVQAESSRLSFFTSYCFGVSVFGSLLLVATCAFFLREAKRSDEAMRRDEEALAP